MKTFRGVQFLVLTFYLALGCYGVWSGIYRRELPATTFGPSEVWEFGALLIATACALYRTAMDIIDEEAGM